MSERNLKPIKVNGVTFQLPDSSIRTINGLVKPYSKTGVVEEVEKAPKFTSKQLFAQAKKVAAAEKKAKKAKKDADKADKNN